MDGLTWVATAGPLVLWLIVLTFVFLECAFIIGLFLPGDSLLLTAGVALATHPSGQTHVWLLAVAAMISAIVGNAVGYRIGATTGHRLVARRGGRYLTQEHLDKAGDLLDRYGFVAVAVARWIPWVRTLCPPLAGAAHMDRTRFTVASVVGAVFWAPTLLFLGFYGGGLLDRIPWLTHAILAGMTVMLVAGTILGLVHYRQEMRRPEVEAES